jgi:hypothetical protein
MRVGSSTPTAYAGARRRVFPVLWWTPQRAEPRTSRTTLPASRRIRASTCVYVRLSTPWPRSSKSDCYKEPLGENIVLTVVSRCEGEDFAPSRTHTVTSPHVAVDLPASRRIRTV